MKLKRWSGRSSGLLLASKARISFSQIESFYGVETMRLVLGQNRIFDIIPSSEICFVVMPSRHLKSQQLALLLRRNGLHCKILGRGMGTLKQIDHEHVMPDLFAISIPRFQEKQLHRYLKLFGSQAVEMPTPRQSAG